MEKLARTLGCPVRTPFEKEGFQERICSKIHVFLKGDINSNSFDPFSEKFSLITEKIGENCNSIKNLPKMRKNSKFVIFELCQHAIPLKKAFLQRTQLKIFSIFFCQNRCWPLFFQHAFLKLCQKKFKYELTCALERFWN